MPKKNTPNDTEKRENLNKDDHDTWTNFLKNITPLQRSQSPHKPEKQTGPHDALRDEHDNIAFEDLLRAFEEGTTHAPRQTDSDEHPESWMQDSLLQLSRVYRHYRDAVTFRDSTQSSSLMPTLDLHHCTEKVAFQKLLTFIQHACIHKERRILVITGRSGILYHHVPKWLRVMTAYVRDVQRAPVNQGGEGALIVSLKN